MKIAIAGHTGFIGSELKKHFRSKNHEILKIGREDFAKGKEHLSKILSGADVLINLAGAPVIKRWTKSYTKELWDSRILTTKALAEAVMQASPKPRFFFSHSGVHIYANTGTHTEDSEDFDQKFLATLCQRWEQEALHAKFFCQTYILRVGMILGTTGGALPQMARPYKMGAGGKIGDGKQMVSWMHISDYLEAIDFILKEAPDASVFNFTSPNPVSNAVLSKTLAKALNKPNFFTVPPIALKMLYGEGASLILSGQEVIPRNLQALGYSFRFPQIQEALEDLL